MANIKMLNISAIRRAVNQSRSKKNLTIVLDEKTVGFIHPSMKDELINEGYKVVALDMDAATLLPEDGTKSDFTHTLDIASNIIEDKCVFYDTQAKIEQNMRSASMKLANAAAGAAAFKKDAAIFADLGLSFEDMKDFL